MTDEQLLELASQHLYCNMSVIEWSGRNEDILNFARAIYEKGREGGYNDGVDAMIKMTMETQNDSL